MLNEVVSDVIPSIYAPSFLQDADKQLVTRIKISKTRISVHATVRKIA